MSMVFHLLGRRDFFAGSVDWVIGKGTASSGRGMPISDGLVGISSSGKSGNGIPGNAGNGIGPSSSSGSVSYTHLTLPTILLV